MTQIKKDPGPVERPFEIKYKNSEGASVDPTVVSSAIMGHALYLFCLDCVASGSPPPQKGDDVMIRPLPQGEDSPQDWLVRSIPNYDDTPRRKEPS